MYHNQTSEAGWYELQLGCLSKCHKNVGLRIPIAGRLTVIKNQLLSALCWAWQSEKAEGVGVGGFVGPNGGWVGLISECWESRIDATSCPYLYM